MILHHYDFSNYSEKIRLALGFKGLAWQSVIIPAFAPKPDYEPLTAGYRRTPALQIGADVYCDTRLILDVLEERHPSPSLYPGDHGPRTKVLCDALTHWAETSLMRPIALYITGLHAARFPPEFHADRALLHRKRQPSLAQVQASAARYWPQVEAQLPALETLLGNGHDFALPEGVSAADFALYEAPWFLETIGGPQAIPNGLPRLLTWKGRVATIGHGEEIRITANEALRQARVSTPLAISSPPPDIAGSILPGDEVTVAPLDQHSPARGRLIGLTRERISIATEHPRIGVVHVHFPRIGYRIDGTR